MSNIATTNAIENALLKGDLSGLTADQRLSYLKQVCDSVGLNMLTKPFEYIQLNGKLTLYATRAATDQLRSAQKVSIKITAREKFDDIYVVTAQATNADGRFDESTGAVNVAGLKGESLANAYLKAETKAKRRVTLSLCGLGLLDESEVETIQDAKKFVEPVVNTTAAIEGHNVEKKHIIEKVADLFKSKETLNNEQLANYVVQCGKKYAGMKLSNMKDFEIAGYLKYLDEGAAKNGKPLSGVFLEFHENATAYLNSLPKVDESDSMNF